MDLFGDPLHEEREIKVHGKTVVDARSIFSFADLSDIPESKSNNVSFMKVEDLDENCRNLLLTSESYVCYSVTQKKNLLRVINTISGEKTILRGHESAILDIALSVDHNVFCSVDNGSSTTSSHIYVWNKVESGFAFASAFQCKLPATIVEAHPLHSHIWAIANGSEIAVFSTKNAQELTSYSQLSAFYRAEKGTVSNLSFSPDGSKLVISIKVSESQSLVQVLRVLGDETSVQSLQTVVSDSNSFLKLETIVAVRTLDHHFILATKADKLAFNLEGQGSTPVSPSPVYYELRVYPLPTTAAETSNKAVQTILFSLPGHMSKLPKTSTSHLNGALDCALSIEPRKRRYALLSSRRSGYIVVLGLRGVSASPLAQGRSPLGAALPIHHISLLHLRAPVISQAVATILGREHHSDVEDEYLEVSAYQEEAAEQASIQQYHIHLLQVLPSQPASLTTTTSSSGGATSVSPRGEGGTILGLLKSMHDTQNVSPVSSGGGANMSELREHPTPQESQETINNTSISALKPIGSRSKLLEALSVPPAETGEGKGMMVDSSALQALRNGDEGVVTGSPQPLPPIGTPIASTAESKSGKLKRLDSSKLFGLQTTAAATSSATGSTAASSAGTVSSGTPTATTTSTAAAAAAPAGEDGLPSFLHRQSSKSTPILSMLRPKTAATTAAVAASSSPPPSTAAPTAPPATAVAPTTPATATAAAHGPLPSSGSSDSPFAPVAVRAVPTATHAKAPSTAAATHAGPAGSTALKGQPLSGNVSEADSRSVLMAAYTMVDTFTSRMNGMMEILDKVHKATSSPLPPSSLPATTSMPSSAEWVAMKEELLKEVQKTQSKQSSTLMNQVKQVVEQENKKVQDLVASQKQELIAQLQEAMVTQMLPTVTNKLKDSMKDSVKQTLAQSFRQAFETSLVPAFQAGTDRMFQQLTASFEEAMQNVSEESQQRMFSQQQSLTALQSEVASLQSTVQSLEGLVHQLLSQQQSLSTLLGNPDHPRSSSSSTSLPPPPPNPVDLVKAGRVNEGVRLALDRKDISVMVEVLSHLTATQVNQQCSHLTRLCITQQLAADMSENMPQEGLGKRVEWIKSLVLSLLNIPLKNDNAEDAAFSRHFKSMISVVLESIQAAQEMIVQAQFDNGEDTQDAMVIPQSTSTDLQLLQCLIQTKI